LKKVFAHTVGITMQEGVSSYVISFLRASGDKRSDGVSSYLNSMIDIFQLIKNCTPRVELFVLINMAFIKKLPMPDLDKLKS